MFCDRPRCFGNVRQPAGQVCFKSRASENPLRAIPQPAGCLRECLSEDSNLSQSPIVQCHHRYQHPESPEGQLVISGKASPHLPHHPPPEMDEDGEKSSQHAPLFLFSPLSLTIAEFLFISFYISGTIIGLYLVSLVCSYFKA